MIAYGFKTAFIAPIASGAKTLTIRDARKPPARHANVGEPIGLWTGLRTADAKRRAVGLVIVRALVRFDRSGIRHASEVRQSELGGDLAEAVARELLRCESDAIAHRDGFENWDSLWLWHDGARRKDKPQPGDGSLCKELVVWKLLDAEQIAALETGRARIEEPA